MTVASSPSPGNQLFDSSHMAESNTRLRTISRCISRRSSSLRAAGTKAIVAVGTGLLEAAVEEVPERFAERPAHVLPVAGQVAARHQAVHRRHPGPPILLVHGPVEIALGVGLFEGCH